MKSSVFALGCALCVAKGRVRGCDARGIKSCHSDMCLSTMRVVLGVGRGGGSVGNGAGGLEWGVQEEAVLEVSRALEDVVAGTVLCFHDSLGGGGGRVPLVHRGLEW